jgi:hypothetical protein
MDDLHCIKPIEISADAFTVNFANFLDRSLLKLTLIRCCTSHLRVNTIKSWCPWKVLETHLYLRVIFVVVVVVIVIITIIIMDYAMLGLFRPIEK